jgi:transposase
MSVLPVSVPAVTADLQRAMSRCQKGSWRYRELRRIKARRDARAARRRKESLHRWTHDLVASTTDLTVIRPRSVQADTASGRGSERDPGAAVAAKAAFNRRILNQMPASAAQMLAYKAAEAGITYHEVADDRIIDVGNLMVSATKEVRKARRSTRRASQRIAA